jgi:hypothetical protein
VESVAAVGRRRGEKTSIESIIDPASSNTAARTRELLLLLLLPPMLLLLLLPLLPLLLLLLSAQLLLMISTNGRRWMRRLSVATIRATASLSFRLTRSPTPGICSTSSGRGMPMIYTTV